jgi:hypothetical protein
MSVRSVGQSVGRRVAYALMFLLLLFIFLSGMAVGNRYGCPELVCAPFARLLLPAS